MSTKALDYKDVHLVSSAISTINSRNDIDVSVDFCGLKLKNPIISSPMSDVSDGYLVQTVMNNGGFGFIHRFWSVSQQISECKKAPGCGAAIGINGDWLERFQELYHLGCRIFCLDVALGAHTNVERAIRELYKQSSDIHLIVGNVASHEGYNFLAKEYGVKGIRVGIAGGKSCSTKNKTGIYYPAFSLLSDINEHRTYPEVSIIADGGIREPGDMCKSIFAGADVIMLGSMLSNTKESPAVKIPSNGKWYTQYRGSASFDIQKTYKDIPKYIEGKTSLIEHEFKTVGEVMASFIEGLISSMSYANARTLTEYRKNMRYITV